VTETEARKAAREIVQRSKATGVPPIFVEHYAFSGQQVLNPRVLALIHGWTRRQEVEG